MADCSGLIVSIWVLWIIHTLYALHYATHAGAQNTEYNKRLKQVLCTVEMDIKTEYTGYDNEIVLEAEYSMRYEDYQLPVSLSHGFRTPDLKGYMVHCYYDTLLMRLGIPQPSQRMMINWWTQSTVITTSICVLLSIFIKLV